MDAASSGAVPMVVARAADGVDTSEHGGRLFRLSEWIARGRAVVKTLPTRLFPGCTGCVVSLFTTACSVLAKC